MAQVHKFETANAAGGRQFVAHKVYINGTAAKFSIWFSDANGGTLVDAERVDRANRSTGVKNTSPQWGELAKRVSSLIAAYDREHA